MDEKCPGAIENLINLARAASQYGPFLFAVLFNVGITYVARRFYKEACSRTRPPAPQHEISTYKKYFWLASLFGIALTIACVGWWFWSQPKSSMYVYSGTIKNLRSPAVVVSDDLYLKKTVKARPYDDDTEVFDMHFVALQNKPFDKKGFEITYGRQEAQSKVSKPLRLPFDENTEPEFEITFDPQKERDNVILTKIAYASPLQGDGNAWAETPDRKYLRSMNPVVKATNKVAPREENDGLSKARFLISEERTPIGQKVAAIERLSKEPALKDVIISQPQAALEVLDLTRHSDPELAAKATRLAENLDLDAILSAALIDSQQARRLAGEYVLFRIETDRAMRILDKAIARGTKQDQAYLLSIQAKVRPGTNSRILKPTGSSEGDRYYVKAEWSPSNEQVVQCLTQLFNAALITNRDIVQEAELMKGRSSRFVYWYSKGWALSIAERIEKCGARADFVGLRG